MNSRILDLTKFNTLKNEFKLELSHLLNSKSGIKQFKSTLRILDRIHDSKILDREITTIANQIFLKDYSGIYSEQYKDFLTKMDMCLGYYEIPRLLRNDQYEQAALLALQEFEELSKKKYLEKGKLAYSLSFFTILKEASKRDDTVIISQLVDVLSKHNLITESNYSHLIANAFAFQNTALLTKLFTDIQNFKFTDTTWERYADTLIQSGRKEDVLLVLSNIESVTVRNTVCLRLIASYGFEECMVLMEGLTSDKLIEIPQLEELPPALLYISDLDNYANVEEKLQVLDKITSEEVKKIAVYSLLASMDNLDGYIASTVFLLNGLRMNQHLLCEKHKDIVFHQLSKFPLKLLGIQFLKFFKGLGLKISIQNYLHLMTCQCYGSEFDTLFFVLIKLLEDHKKIPKEVLEFLTELNGKVNDSRLDLFLHTDVSQSIADIKSKINYEFIEKNLEYEREREKVDHELIYGQIEYEYAADIKLVDFFDV